MALAPRSIKALEGVHPDLVKVVRRADELGARFHITDGLRTEARQRELVKAGKSKTMKSRHLTGHAVDFVVAEPGGGVSYEHADMKACADIFKQAARELGVAIEWGGDWKSFVDTPHIELDRKVYAANKPIVSGLSAENKPESVLNVADSAPIPAGRLRTSGTVWGTLGGAMAGVMAFFEQAASGLVEWAAKLAEFGPAQAALASMGGNIKSITLGLGIGSAVYVISRRARAKQEGKAG